jgi:predicted aspartyl protease
MSCSPCINEPAVPLRRTSSGRPHPRSARRTTTSARKCLRAVLVSSLMIAAAPLSRAVKLQMRDGRPIIDGVYVNGHGPYRFLVDTGANVNLIDLRLARKIGMDPTFHVELASAAGKVLTPGSDENEIALDPVKASGQKFLFSGLDAIHNSSPDVQGVLGQWFLSQFDYTLDLQGKRLEFGKLERSGTRSQFRMVNARPVVSTSLGDLALDSGEAKLVLFGTQPEDRSEIGYELRTVAGSQRVGTVSGKALIIQGKKVSSGDALAFPDTTEPGVDGLMPLSLFKSIYVCNSEGYVVFE